MKRSFTLLLLFSITILGFAQILDPIKWKFSTVDISETEKELRFTANIDKGGHLYGTDITEGGPIATSFNFNEISGA